ncbi:MAG: glycosyltransferase [Candidatus Dadabacteria bacterium]|nr:MAG: glycosyltransferase [Candidatus Dadabacteria bacterium]
MVNIWSRFSARSIRKLAAKGCFVCREKTNALLLDTQRVQKYILRLYHELDEPQVSDTQVVDELHSLKLSHKVIFSNPYAIQLAKRHDLGFDLATKVVEMHYGWEPKEIRPIHRDYTGRLRFTFVGRGTTLKGLGLLLEAWESIKGDCELHLFGSISDLIRKRYGNVLTRKDVIVHNYTRNIQQIYESSDILVIPSFLEGGPMVAYEGVGAGLPLLGTRAGIGFVGHEGANSLVFDPFDKDSLREAILWCLSSREKLHQMARVSASRAPRFTWEVASKKRANGLKEIALNRFVQQSDVS